METRDVAWLDRLFDQMAQHTATMLKRDGEVHSIVYGLDPRGVRCSIIQGAVDAEPSVLEDRPDTMVLPAPLQNYLDVIRVFFRQRGANAAMWVGETWLYPEGEEGQEAARAWYAGHGGPPSQHPNRREAVLLTVMSPIRGYMRTSAWLIERRPHRPPTLGRDVAEDLRQDGDDVMVMSWLEECLPAPDDRPAAT